MMRYGQYSHPFGLGLFGYQRTRCIMVVWLHFLKTLPTPKNTLLSPASGTFAQEDMLDFEGRNKVLYI